MTVQESIHVNFNDTNSIIILEKIVDVFFRNYGKSNLENMDMDKDKKDKSPH